MNRDEQKKEERYDENIHKNLIIQFYLVLHSV